MKVLFIENRFKTYFWYALEQKILEAYELETFWIVQNTCFKPKSNNINTIKYPKIEELINPSTENQISLLGKDRGAYFFGNKGLHYDYYEKKIERILLDIKPDLVIGESTLFHELLTIGLCKKHNIKYVTPSSCRYPTGRFSLYKDGTLNVYDEKQCETTEQDLITINAIVNRQSTPDYMNKNKFSEKWLRNLKLSYNLMYSFFSWLRGERFNTPKPSIKGSQLFRQRIVKYKWDKYLSSDVNDIPDWNKVVLFPLQMQPESNIDVWGYPYNDQLQNLKRLLDSLPSDKIIVVKPNPKSKNELSSDLYNFISASNRVKCLRHSVTMTSIFPSVKVVYTVTGTIGIEVILAKKELITENNSIYLNYPNVYMLDGKSLILSEELHKSERILSHFRENSFQGVISDPLLDSTCVDELNVQNVVHSLASTFNFEPS